MITNDEVYNFASELDKRLSIGPNNGAASIYINCVDVVKKEIYITNRDTAKTYIATIREDDNND